ncbi:hypothetical protein AB6A40_006142 [Gnathostoma spinigerum]|uniref:Uncharacterized protein n=1 Tax=Gnathostoma spinigerum TaxID=75299 RepID=A0ABD6EHI8_9BILA
MLSSVVDHHSDEPFARWKSEAAADPSILNERIRFPYACNMITANRLVKTGMNEELASYDRSNIHNSGIATKELANLYEKFGEGGFGLIVSGAINVNEERRMEET